MKKTVALVIMDGFGKSDNTYGNAIASAETPNIDRLMKEYPTTLINASGRRVGLPEGQMGNSEVGHLNIGAGRVVYQDITRIDKAIEEGEFFKNDAFKTAMERLTDDNALHLVGLLSNGGVHSSINHLFALIDMAKRNNVKNVYIHAITDGRDVPPDSAINFVAEVEKETAKIGVGKIATVVGRYYYMDRDKRWDRVEKGYNTVFNGVGTRYSTAEAGISASYKDKVLDEFIEPIIVGDYTGVKDGDSVIFYNYRSDRAREITFAITDSTFDKFETKKFNNLLFSPMEEYSDKLTHLNTLFPPTIVEDNLSRIISDNNMKQFHIAETTKYAHVTFFFNGGIEQANINEDRKLIDSIDTPDFSYYPKMRAIEITQEMLDAIASNKYDFLLVNYSNPDMIGHTGNFNASVEAIQCVEKQAYAVALATLMAGGECIITADHGNAEEVMDKNGNKMTAHTTNPVPFILVSDKNKNVKLSKKGSLANIAPTVLKLLGIDIPANMEKPLF